MLMKEKDFMKSAGTRGYSPLARVMTLAVMLLAMAATAWAANTVTWTTTQLGTLAGKTTATFDGVTITTTSAITVNSQRATFNGATFSVEDGNITKIVLKSVSGVSSYPAGWTIVNSDATWTGSAKSVSCGYSGGVYNIEFTIETVYTVTMAEGTVDAAKWTISPTEAAEGKPITATYSGTKHVKSVTAVTKAAAPAVSYDKTVSINDGAVTVTAGEHWLITGTGTATSNQITISDGATVTLDGVNISGSDFCIKCAGSATIILKDGTTNTLTSSSDVYPALWAGDAGTTMTIQGSTGALTVQSGKYCAGIGGGYKNTNRTCGNIRIEGGVITATGGQYAAGIGSDCGIANCGNIDITGGTIVATGGSDAAGIGSGYGDEVTASCGNITIKKTVTSVTATKGSGAPNSIGAGGGTQASCGTVTIEDGANVTQN